jgi:hypothetical protein
VPFRFVVASEPISCAGERHATVNERFGVEDTDAVLVLRRHDEQGADSDSAVILACGDGHHADAGGGEAIEGQCGAGIHESIGRRRAIDLLYTVQSFSDF